MKEALNLASRLFLITAVAALVLGFVNKQTEPVIAEREAKILAESLGVAYPGGEDFVPLESDEVTSLAGEGGSVTEIYDVNSGEGHVYNVTAKGGYGGPIQFIVGMKDGQIVGFSVLNHAETPGFGAVVADDEFADGVTGVDASGEIGASTSPAENEIHAISGSTHTTNAVVNGLNEAAQIDQQLN